MNRGYGCVGSSGSGTAGLTLAVFTVAGLLFFAGTSLLSAQVYPTVLYSGVNPITLSDADGIRKIEILTARGWSPVRIGYETQHYSVLTAPVFSRCAREAELRLFVKRIDVAFEVQLRLTDCDGKIRRIRLQLQDIWTVYHENFGLVEEGERPCLTFSVQSGGGDFTVESVTTPSRLFSIRYPFARPPVRLSGIRTYRYNVCFTGGKPGTYRVPIEVNVRRDQPAGGYATYVVADTAVIQVFRYHEERVEEPVSPPVRIRPPAPALPPDAPELPARPPATLLPSDLVDVENQISVASPDRPERIPELEVPAPPVQVFDPSTFRVVLAPGARLPEEGQGYVGTYDLVVLSAGYGVSDNVAIIGALGGIPWMLERGAGGGLGVSYSFLSEEAISLAAGSAVAVTRSEESTIGVVAPWLVATYGNPDASLSALFSWSYRKHYPGDEAAFERNAALLIVGGDVRLGGNLKLVSEVALIQDAVLQPAVVGLRYFGVNWAVEAGIGIDWTLGDGDVPALPVLTFLYSL